VDVLGVLKSHASTLPSREPVTKQSKRRRVWDVVDGGVARQKRTKGQLGRSLTHSDWLASC
jgi:hypothetical protein